VGTFTVLGEAELAAVAEAFDLGRVRSTCPIAAGTINSNYEVVADRGRFFARVNEGKAEVDVAWEARLISALAEHGVATPPPLVARDGRPYAPLDGLIDRSGSAGPRSPAEGRGGVRIAKWVSVFPWRDGRHLEPAEVTAIHAHTFGQALARLHVVGLDLPSSWRRGSIYDLDHLVARYHSFAQRPDPVLAHAVEVLDEELACAREVLALCRGATHGVIHGDLFRDNVLWQGEQIAAILDFEQASGGSLVYDLAVCINDWCCSAAGTPDVARARALVSGYCQVRELTESDRKALPAELRIAAARFTITRITDVYLARVDNPEKDFRAFLARCDAWRDQALGQLIATS
jgi:homoserine kinase type II